MLTKTIARSETGITVAEIKPSQRKLRAVLLVLSLATVVTAWGIGWKHNQARAIPQGAMESGWVQCWNVADGYDGSGRIVWDYAAGECVRIGE